MEGARARHGDRPRAHVGFGLRYACSFELPGQAAPASSSEPEVALRLADAAEIDAVWSGPAPSPAVAETRLDGVPYRAERGAAGDHRMTYGDRAHFHLSPDRGTLLCAPSDPAAPEWRRVLLDSVLATVSLCHGYEALHAAAVSVPAGTIALMGRTGGGKTTLAAELVRRGLDLMCDDVLALSRDADGDGRVVAHPAPPVMNLPAGAAAPAGRLLARIGSEAWITVDAAARRPAPVAAVCLIDRRPGARPAVVPGPGSPLDLLAHGLRSGSAPERRQARFELLADLAAQASTYVLEADTGTPPAELADALEAAIPAFGRERAGAAR